ncbi:hypothetical protein UFOVP1264_85 [uncultured Caudovirales phage]|uniref:Uncharacterized protein n=1 Tax=uncultured Caudovirales phage TaxID=2100421 RepID=A0A6J5RAQ8_9CAUD|nr:hypothetical protein UFOVP1264_85 [uncultured Caudovirales phage]
MIPYNWKPSESLGLNVDVRISTSSNVYNTDGSENLNATWLYLNDGEVYRVAKGSFENSATQFRRDDVQNAFLEGKYTINALRENVTETLVVYVKGNTAMEMSESVRKLTDALSQIRFRMEVVIDNASRGWWCYASDFTINTSHEFLHSRMAQITAQIPRDPVETLSEVI